MMPLPSLARISAVALAAILLCSPSLAAKTLLFPNTAELSSPDGRWAIRNEDPKTPASDFGGTFHSLWVIEKASGRSHKLCDYLGVAAVSWSDNDVVVITEYVAKKSSRTLITSVSGAKDAVLLDRPTLLHLVPAESREALRTNDHVFIEGQQVEKGTLHFKVWGYTAKQTRGFHWDCQYLLVEGGVSCRPAPSH
jgi:hypothetical protein